MIMSFIANTQNALLLNMLYKFYENKYNLDIMFKIISGQSKLSLRIIDWFVTNYAKKNDTMYAVSNEYVKDNRFNVNINYKLKLKSYSKKKFDPFCRIYKLSIPYKPGMSIETTLGQLHFFKWAIENDIIGYILKNYAAIEQDMNERSSSSKKNKKIRGSCMEGSASTPTTVAIKGESGAGASAPKTRKKREELSVSAAKSVKRVYVDITIQFI